MTVDVSPRPSIPSGRSHLSHRYISSHHNKASAVHRTASPPGQGKHHHPQRKQNHLCNHPLTSHLPPAILHSPRLFLFFTLLQRTLPLFSPSQSTTREDVFWPVMRWPCSPSQGTHSPLSTKNKFHTSFDHTPFSQQAICLTLILDHGLDQVVLLSRTSPLHKHSPPTQSHCLL